MRLVQVRYVVSPVVFCWHGGGSLAGLSLFHCSTILQRDFLQLIRGIDCGTNLAPKSISSSAGAGGVGHDAQLRLNFGERVERLAEGIAGKLVGFGANH